MFKRVCLISLKTNFHSFTGDQKRKAYRTLADGGVSLLLSRVRHEKALREKELRRKQMEEKKAEKEAAYRKAIEWENTLLNEGYIREMKAMWEVISSADHSVLNIKQYLPDIYYNIHFCTAASNRALFVPDAVHIEHTGNFAVRA